MGGSASGARQARIKGRHFAVARLCKNIERPQGAPAAAWRQAAAHGPIGGALQQQQRSPGLALGFHAPTQTRAWQPAPRWTLQGGGAGKGREVSTSSSVPARLPAPSCLPSSACHAAAAWQKPCALPPQPLKHSSGPEKRAPECVCPKCEWVVWLAVGGARPLAAKLEGAGARLRGMPKSLVRSLEEGGEEVVEAGGSRARRRGEGRAQPLSGDRRPRRVAAQPRVSERAPGRLPSLLATRCPPEQRRDSLSPARYLHSRLRDGAGLCAGLAGCPGSGDVLQMLHSARREAA